MASKYGTKNDDILFVKDLAVLRIYGLGGNDTIHASSSGAQRIDGGSGNDLILAYAGDDTLQGTTGNDTLSGGLGNDVIDGGTDAPAGDDVYVQPRDSDTVTYTYAQGMRIDLAAGTASVRPELLAGKPIPMDTDTLIDIENVIGSTYADNIYGDGERNRIEGHLGNDYVLAGGNRDTLFGDGGNDTLDGQGDNDLVTGGEGNDALFGGTGRDTLDGGEGNDFLYSTDNDYTVDTLTGGAGRDHASLQMNDRFDGGSGTDSASFFHLTHGVRVDLAAGTVGKMGEAVPTKQTLVSVEDVAGSKYRDFLYGTEGTNVMYGNEGNDVLRAGGGLDLVNGGNGDDVLFGEGGPDQFQFANNMADAVQFDVIADFGTGDRIRLTGFAIDFDDLDTNNDGKISGADATADLVNGSLEFHVPGITDWTVRLSNVQSLTESQFMFA